jgi:type II secretory pathway pseudopilin PulG
MNLQIVLGKNGTARGAFTLVEVMVSVAVCGFLFVSLYAGIAQGTSSLQRAREKLRATQILSEKLEVIRLYNWDQVNTSGYIPSTFVEYQYPNDDTNMVGRQGITYRGTIQLSAADVHPNYTNTMRKVVATVTWNSLNITNQQSMETFISEFGVQKYVY